MRIGDRVTPVNNVLLVPDLGKNLYSPGQAASEGIKFFISGDYMTIFDKGTFVNLKVKLSLESRKARTIFTGYRLTCFIRIKYQPRKLTSATCQRRTWWLIV